MAFVKRGRHLFHAFRLFDRQQGAAPVFGQLLLIVDENIRTIALAVGKTIDNRQR